MLDVLWILPSQYVLRKAFSSWCVVPAFTPILSVPCAEEVLGEWSVEVLFDEGDVVSRRQGLEWYGLDAAPEIYE
jgi:hypothetical protein